MGAISTVLFGMARKSNKVFWAFRSASAVCRRLSCSSLRRRHINFILEASICLVNSRLWQDIFEMTIPPKWLNFNTTWQISYANYSTIYIKNWIRTQTWIKVESKRYQVVCWLFRNSVISELYELSWYNEMRKSNTKQEYWEAFLWQFFINSAL